MLPPSWIFPIAWAIFYAVMGFSAYLIHSANACYGRPKRALTLYWIQLAVNFSWSIVFFKFEALWAAFAVIITLLLLIIFMVISFKKISPLAGYINIPYLIWVIFASYLNLAAAIIN